MGERRAGEPLAGGVCRQREQAEEDGLSAGVGRVVAPKGGGDPLDALGAQGSDRRKAPSGKGEPVEQALGEDRPRRSGAETPQAEHRFGAGQRLEAGSPVGIDARPASQRTRPPEASGTTTIPANRSAPRSMNSPESRILAAEKPRDSRACRSPPPPSPHPKQ